MMTCSSEVGILWVRQFLEKKQLEKYCKFQVKLEKGQSTKSKIDIGQVEEEYVDDTFFILWKTHAEKYLMPSTMA